MMEIYVPNQLLPFCGGVIFGAAMIVLVFYAVYKLAKKYGISEEVVDDVEITWED